MFEVRIQQSDEVHTYFTEIADFTAVEVDDGTRTVMLRTEPTNGQQRHGKSTLFPLHRIISITEVEHDTA